jgi:hypothetical protein
MRLSSNIEDLIMDGKEKIFIKELTTKDGQSRSSRFSMETALVGSPHSHGIGRSMIITWKSATTTRFSSISPAPANSPPNTLDMIYTAIRIGVLHIVEVGGVN